MTDEAGRGPSPQRDLTALCAVAFRSPERAATEILRIAGKDRDRSLRIAGLLAAAPDPSGALGYLDRFAAGGAIPHGDDALQCLILLLGHSSWLAEAVLTDRGAFDAALEARGQPAPAADTYRSALRRALRDSPPGRTWQALLAFKNRRMITIGLKDFLREWPLPEVAEQISFLADAILDEALELTVRETALRYGAPSGEDEAGRRQRASAAVIALGKLGGLELNYSSDVDLLLVYSHDGDTRGAGRDPSTIVTNKEFFTRAAQSLTRHLTGSDGERWILRVDWGLRPGGKDGDLALPLGATLGYYATWARPWERQALIKARPAAGDARLGREFVSRVQGLIYHRDATSGATDAIREMKDRIDASLAHRGTALTDLKLGRGGIREIEFNVQGRQLLHAGPDPWLRDTNTLRALHRLVERGHVSRSHHSALSSAYVFLREAEHRIQLRRNLQRSTLPPGRHESRILARSMGFLDEDGERATADFLAELDRHRTEVRSLYDGFLASQSQERLELGAAPDPFLDPMSDSEVIRCLETAGWPEPASLVPAVRRTARHLAGPGVPAENRRAFRQVTPVVIREAASVASAGRALRNLERLIESLAVDPAGMRAFLQTPERFGPILRLFGGSQHLADILIHRPALMLEPDFGRALATERTLTAHTTALRDRLRECASMPERLSALRRYQHGELLLIGLKDLSRQINIRSVRRGLSELAEACVRGAFRAAIARLEEGGVRLPGPFSVIALGRLGYREMDYGSDLDLIFVYHASGADAALHARACDLAASVVEVLGTITRDGPLYPVDSRLRPFGGQGEIAQSARSVLDYIRGTAGVWEMQSYLKARAVAGDLRAGKRLVRQLEQAILNRAAHEDPGAEVRSMLMRLREASENPAEDLKSGPGGMHTVQFALHCLQLRHHVPSPARKSTTHLMRSLRDLDLLDEATYTELFQGERLLRRIEHGLRLIFGRAISRLPDNRDVLVELARGLGYEGPPESALAAMARAVEETRSAVESAFQRLVAAPRSGGASH